MIGVWIRVSGGGCNVVWGGVNRKRIKCEYCNGKFLFFFFLKWRTSCFNIIKGVIYFCFINLKCYFLYALVIFLSVFRFSFRFVLICFVFREL